MQCARCGPRTGLPVAASSTTRRCSLPRSGSCGSTRSGGSWNGKCRIDRVFGFFYAFINTHTDIDQQLARVRNPGAIDVWISPGTFNFTCDIEVIKDDLARAYFVKRAVWGRRDDGMVEYDRDD